MTKSWHYQPNWLPWNRRWQTEPVPLADAAARSVRDRPSYSNAMTHCLGCGDEFLAESAPLGFPRWCSQVCVNEARRMRIDGEA